MKYCIIVLLLIPLLLPSCRSGNRDSYAIRDFNDSIQPYLIHIISKGIVGYDSSTQFINAKVTDKELWMLSKSEHPVLRAVAFREMMNRPGFDHFNILMNHLDDTAIVQTDEGEWGIDYWAVSDDIIRHMEFKNIGDKKKAIEQVLTKHNHLKSAYIILDQLEPEEKYYSFIKQMAQRDESFFRIEYALYGLAKFKKPDDIYFIKEKLLSHSHKIGSLSFNFMSKFPDNNYLEVYEKFYRLNFNDWDNDRPYDSEITNFFKSLASYKNDRSAKLLNTILNTKPFMPMAPDRSWLRTELVNAIWHNPCTAYSALRKQVKYLIEKQEEFNRKLGIDSLIIEPFPGTFKPRITWERNF